MDSPAWAVEKAQDVILRCYYSSLHSQKVEFFAAALAEAVAEREDELESIRVQCRTADGIDRSVSKVLEELADRDAQIRELTLAKVKG